ASSLAAAVATAWYGDGDAAMKASRSSVGSATTPILASDGELTRVQGAYDTRRGSVRTIEAMSDERPVSLSSQGPPSTVPDPQPEDAQLALEAALGRPAGERHAALAAVCARWPRFLDAWARLGDASADDVEAYAYYRVGYHRGLDRLRANGW